MVNEDIVGGLKSALARGESLKQAMMSFYRAGYKKQDIEWAAKSLQMQNTQNPIQKQVQQPTKPVQQSKQIPAQQPTQIPSQKKTITTQQVSDYNQEPDKLGRKIKLILLISLLIILLGVLAGIFLFKEELIGFFNNFL